MQGCDIASSDNLNLIIFRISAKNHILGIRGHSFEMLQIF